MTVRLLLVRSAKKMSCSIQSQKQQLLHCTLPKPMGEMESLYVYFKFDSGHEKTLVMCTKENVLECSNEDGFTCKQIHPRHAEITIPESFASQSGYFRCVMPGVPPRDVTRCQWPPSDSGRLDDLRNPYSTFAPPLGSTSTTSAGVVIGALIPAVLILVAIIVILVIVRRKCTKRSGSLKTCLLEECICNAEDRRKRLCWRLEPTQKECEAERGNLQSDHKTESSGSESPILLSHSGNSKTSDDMPHSEGDKGNQCPLVQITKNGHIGT